MVHDVADGVTEVEVDLQNVRCFSDITPERMKCVLTMRSSGLIADSIVFTISDVVTLFNSNLGQPIILFNFPIENIEINILGGIGLPPIDGDIVFSQITNVIGGRVCADFGYTLSGGTYVEGNFCARVDNP